MKPVYFKSAVVAAIFLAGNAHAQTDSCNVFLQGNHVEIGISPSGSYGSSVQEPAGYHGNVFDGSTYMPCGVSTSRGAHLGFVADPQMNGWATTGTNHYMGDYFLPGSPFEGWELQIDTMRVQAFNSDTSGFDGTLTGTGSNISYSSTPISSSSIWQGEFDTLMVTQITTVDSGSLYFTLQVTLTNLGVLPKNNVYYFRSLDPDNDQPWPGGSFSTYNKIAHQVTDTTVVTATGHTVAWSQLALGTTDTNARCLVYTDWPLAKTVDLGTVYNQSYTPAVYADGAEDDGDLAIGLVYHVAHLSGVDSAADSTYRVSAGAHLHPANSATMTFFYSFSQPGMDSALSAMNRTTTVLLPTGVKNINGNGDIKVYPNPAKELISVTGLLAGDQLTLYDMMGKAILVQAISSQGVNTVSVGNIPAGAYILSVRDAAGNVKSRMPVQKL